MARRVRSSVATWSHVPRPKRKTTSPASDHWPMAAAPRAARVMSTFMSTWRARRLKKAARADVGAAGDHRRGEEPGDAAGASAPATKPATTRAPESSVSSARRSRNHGSRPCRGRAGSPPRCRGPGAAARLALDRVVAEAPHGGEHAAEVGLGRVDGDGQGRGAEVDVGGAHSALSAQRALQLDGAVGAVHAGDVQHAALGAVLPGERREQVELPVVVDREGAVVGAVRLGAGAARERAHVVGAQRRLVEVDVEKAARDVRLDGVHAVEAAQLAADLVHAPAALRLARQQHRQLEGLLGHDAAPASRPWRTCSRVMSRSTRMCASSGE